MSNRSATCPPLGEGSKRVNIQRPQRGPHPLKSSPIPPNDGLQPNTYLVPKPLALRSRSSAPPNPVANPRLSAIAQDIDNTKGNRNSQISTTSTNSNGSKLKQCIGPWRLGKTLGRGATARVRLARNIYTGQEAAVKIVQKNSARMSQAGSLAALDRAEATLPIEVDGLRRMPVGIEREIAIMKLIQHPNIIGLYDIWENHSEIYLVLEYVDNGELFTHIMSKGLLGEEEAMKYFRQILSAVGYCHSFNICHRDLKPENILLTKSGDIKIADFGMAALHQSPDHQLDTSCGSPHYAAPELIRGASYKGNMVDIWSMGVVLFATLAGRLPFDVDGGTKDWLGPLLAKIRKGKYEMSPHFSYEASCLIWAMLQVNPEKRIRLSQIWAHPLLKKYDYLDNLGGGKYPQSPSAKDYARPILRKSDIQKDIVRYLRSMWHKLSEQEIIDALMTKEPNDQKLFYSLLSKYQESILENYQGDLAYSTSDYHHVRPARLTKTYSTCHFPQGNSKGHGHGRQVSKFTVISNVPETEHSYDPFKASRPQHLNGHNDGLKITIHRARNSLRDPARSAGLSATLRQNSRGSSAASGSVFSRHGALAPPSRMYASRSSIASSTRSRNSAIRATVGYGKRGVSFNHLRRDSVIDLRKRARAVTNGRHSNFTEVTDDDGDVLRPDVESPGSTLYIRSKKPPVETTKSNRTSSIWNDDVRHLSSSLAKDCDEAFNRTSTALGVHKTAENGQFEKSSLEQKRSKKQDSSALFKAKKTDLDSRPLPPAPERTASVRAELIEARKQAEYRKMFGNDDSPSYLNRLVTHIDRLIQPISPSRAVAERRTASAPIAETRHSSLGAGRQLPSIYELGENSSPVREPELASFQDRQRRYEGKHGRIASAPEASSVWETMHTLAEDRFEAPNFKARETIRVVPPSPMSPVRPPAPLNIRKKSSQVLPSPMMSGGIKLEPETQKPKHQRSGSDFRQQYSGGSETVISPDLERIDENADPFGNDSVNSGTGTIQRKKSNSWFKRNSKASSDRDLGMSVFGNETSSAKGSQEFVKPPYDRPRNPHMVAPISAPASADPPKKKASFTFPKWLSKKRDSQPDMAVAGVDVYEDDSSIRDSIAQQKSASKGNLDYEDGRNRTIAPQRNWLAKLFNVKPACRFICFATTKRCARQEIVAILKEWRRYGIQELQIDKERNIVFGKVGERNFFNMKAVAFAGEVMTVIEHGKRSQLSIVRFTQEQGAASSFHKVIDSMEVVFRGKKVLVADKRKEKMMIKTMSSI